MIGKGILEVKSTKCQFHYFLIKSKFCWDQDLNFFLSEESKYLDKKIKVQQKIFSDGQIVETSLIFIKSMMDVTNFKSFIAPLSLYI